MDTSNYLIVEARALPEVYLKVLEAKRLMDGGRCKTVQEATKQVGLSRSAFYKYKDSVFSFSDSTRGHIITMAMDLEDVPGLLSHVLNQVAQSGANILTINQTIPINHIAYVTITLEPQRTNQGSEISDWVEKLKEIPGVESLKILARE